MSFPTIPDINPEISITRDEAINLLLVSIALEEISLADLIDAETKKICHVTEKECNQHYTNDLLLINRSVDQTLKELIKLQMLLQFKLENVQEIICPCTSTCTTTCTITKTTTTTTTTKTCSTSTTKTTTTSTTTTCPTTTTKTSTTRTTTTTTSTKSTSSTKTTTTCKKPCKCCKEAKARGYVANKCDPFHGGISKIYYRICNHLFHLKNKPLSYMVEKGDMNETFKISTSSLKVDYPSIKHPNRIRFTGSGSIMKKTYSHQYLTDSGSFELLIWRKLCTHSFQMIIRADNKQNLNHDSGEVIIKDPDIIIEKPENFWI